MTLIEQAEAMAWLDAAIAKRLTYARPDFNA